MQIKEETSGTAKGNYEIVYDEETNDYIIKPIDDGQVRFDDSGFSYNNVEEANFEDCEEADDSIRNLELKPREVMYIESGLTAAPSDPIEEDDDYDDFVGPFVDESIFEDD